jgi:hypothetical protein
MPFTEDQDMIQAFAAKRPDQAFNIWVLPGRPRCDRAVSAMSEGCLCHFFARMRAPIVRNCSSILR